MTLIFAYLFFGASFYLLTLVLTILLDNKYYGIGYRNNQNKKPSSQADTFVQVL